MSISAYAMRFSVSQMENFVAFVVFMLKLLCLPNYVNLYFYCISLFTFLGQYSRKVIGEAFDKQIASGALGLQSPFKLKYILKVRIQR